jgi:hypothetical protein
MDRLDVIQILTEIAESPGVFNITCLKFWPKLPKCRTFSILAVFNFIVFYLSVRLFIPPSVCLSEHLSVNMHVYLFAHLSI